MSDSAVKSTRRGISVITGLALSLVMGFSATPVPVFADDAADATQALAQADATLQNFLKDPDMTSFREYAKNAKGVYIVPKLVKGAFMVGLEGGNGVLLAREGASGAWSEPGFYEISAASFGLQAGAQRSEVILLIMTEKGLESMLTSSVKLGADGSVAVGPIGGGIEGSTTPSLNADFLSFARSKGLYAGLSLEGASVRTRDDLNQAYYGKPVRPTNIFVSRDVSANPHSKELHMTLVNLAGGQ
jgi:SH3 domain-containing YSC84-like protein 1